MDELKIFNNEDFGEVRIIIENNIEWLTDNQILAIVRSVQSRNAGPFDELLYGLSHEQIFYTLEYLVSDWKCNNHD